MPSLILKYLITTCQAGHRARVRPASVAGGTATFGSDSDFCSIRMGRRGERCERPVVSREPYYGDTKTYITVNRGVIDRNRKRGENAPPVRVSRGKFGRVRYGHRVRVLGPAIFVYDPKNPLPHGARLWVETDSRVEIE